MPAFSYTAIDGAGKRVSGRLVVRTKPEAYRELESQRLTPVQVVAEGEGSSETKRSGRSSSSSVAVSMRGGRRLNRTQLILFTEELADLLDAGMQLEQALKILSERQSNKAIRTVAETLRDEIREGARFSKALEKASPSFDELYRNLVAAGESSGSLPVILRRMTVNLKQLQDLQSRTLSAMIYPLVVFLMCVVLVFVSSTLLLPTLTEMIRKTGQEMPWITEVLIRFSDFMAAYWWVILGLAVLAVVIFRVVISTAGGRLWWDQARLKLFAFGPVIAGRFYAQFCHTASNLVNNGVPLLNALKLMTRATPNRFLRGHLETVVEDIGEGASLARAMEKEEVFPGALIDRIAIGEKTGELGKAFAKAAAKYDEELNVRINRLTTLLPMVMLIIVALIVLAVAYSLITTIFGSMSGVRGN
ncbi:MAG: type II secretion system F family protein [Verrucomicrobiota bacterium]